MRAVLIAAALGASSALAQVPTATPSPPPAAPAPAEPSLPPIGGAPAPAPAPAAPPATETAAAASSTPAYEEPPLNWGLLVDAGIPDGAGASIVFRPMTWLRLTAGGTHNLVSPGVRGGVSVVPFYFPFTPSLNLEVGHFFAGDVRPILQQAFCPEGTCPGGTAFPVDNQLLQQVSYQYGNAHLGLEFGLPRNFIIFLRAGISYLQTTLIGFQQVLQDATGDTTLVAQDLNIKLTAPSLKLGVLVYF